MLTSTAAFAQDANRASREREALRRTQQALKQAEEQRSALQREKEALARDKASAEARAEAATQRARAAAGSADAALRGQRSRLAQLQADVAAAQLAATQAAQRHEEALRAADTRIEVQARELAATRAEAGERGRTLASVTALLEQRTQALVAAESKNQRLYTLSRELVEQVRARTGRDPLLGFDGVERENWAEQARDRIEPERVAR